MRQRSLLLGGAGVGLLLVGLVSGLVLGGAFAAHASPTRAQAAILTTNNTNNTNSMASDPSASKYCQVYENNLASDLNLSGTSALEAANVKALQQTLAQMARDGEITPAEESATASVASQLGTNLCAHLNAQSIMGALASNSLVTTQFLTARKALLDGTASALGMPSSTLSSDLESGKTVAALAQVQHASLPDVEKAYLAAANTFLAQDVTNGVITAAQQREISAMLQKAVAQGHFPLLDGGMAGMMG